MKEELIELAYECQDDFSNRDFECLIQLIYDGTISTFEELAKYGCSK